MLAKKLAVDFVIVFVVSMAVTVLVGLAWNFAAHGTGTIDWEASFRFALVFAIILTLLEVRRSRRN